MTTSVKGGFSMTTVTRTVCALGVRLGRAAGLDVAVVVVGSRL